MRGRFAPFRRATRRPTVLDFGHEALRYHGYRCGAVITYGDLFARIPGARQPEARAVLEKGCEEVQYSPSQSEIRCPGDSLAPSRPEMYVQNSFLDNRLSPRAFHKNRFLVFLFSSVKTSSAASNRGEILTEVRTHEADRTSGNVPSGFGLGTVRQRTRRPHRAHSNGLLHQTGRGFADRRCQRPYRSSALGRRARSAS